MLNFYFKDKDKHHAKIVQSKGWIIGNSGTGEDRWILMYAEGQKTRNYWIKLKKPQTSP